MFYLDYTIVESRMFIHLFYLILLHFKKRIRMKNIIQNTNSLTMKIFINAFSLFEQNLSMIISNLK